MSTWIVSAENCIFEQKNKENACEEKTSEL